MTIQVLFGDRGMFMPSIMSAPDAANRDSAALNGATEKFAYVFRASQTGLISNVSLKVGTSGVLNAASVVRLSFQNVSAADGFPDGVQDETVDIAGSAVVPGAVIGGALAGFPGELSVTQGDLLAVVVEYQTFTAADTFNIAEVSTRGGTASQDLMNRAFPYALHDAGAGYVRDTENTPYISMGYPTASPAPAPDTPAAHATAPGLVTFDSSTTPDEIGIEINIPFRARIAGCWFFGRIETNANLVLYDSTDTALMTMLLDKDVRGYTAGPANHFIRFTGTFDLDANQSYKLALRPVDAAALISLGQVTGVWHALGGFKRVVRTDLGAFTISTTISPQMGVYIIGFEDGSGGSTVSGAGRGFSRGMVR